MAVLNQTMRVYASSEIVSVEHLFGGETRENQTKPRDSGRRRMVHGAPTRVSKR